MTDTSTPPDRTAKRWGSFRELRRRRVVVTIAVLVLGLCWWMWPRADQRFVGTWELDQDNYGPVGFRLSADGSAEFASNLRLVGVESLARPWKVEGDILFISSQPNQYVGLPAKLKLQLESAWERFAKPSEAFSQWRIVEITADSLTLEAPDEIAALRDSGSSQQFVVRKYHRLPDGVEVDTHGMRHFPR